MVASPPQSPLRFGLPDRAIQAIQQVLADHAEVEMAIVYGSRAMGCHRPASDIDLPLIGPSITSRALAQIEAELDDLLLPAEPISAVTRPFSQGPDRKLLVTVPDAWMATHSRV